MLTRRFGAIFALLFGCISLVYAAPQSKAAFYRDFWWPYYHGKRLNYCTVDGRFCGLPVAQHFCRVLGYADADHQVIDYNVGSTYFFSTKGLTPCYGLQCNGFKIIRCVDYLIHNPPKEYAYRLKQFSYPRYNNARVDWCYDGQHGCGQPAAYSFCRRMGYLKTQQFAIQKQVGRSKALANQKLCLGSNCNGFAYISCYR